MSAVLPRPEGPVVLCILDGVGLGRGGDDDAVATAPTPNLDLFRATAPFCALTAHGRAVGLPSDEDMGNSEVGHNALGAGRVFDQGAKLVEAALASGAIWRSEAWQALIRGRTFHLLGLVSDGNVHSHVRHLTSMIDQAARDGVRRLRVHVLTDGRDVGGHTALTWLVPLEAQLAAHAAAGRDYRIASGGGRMALTMDRYEADWDMVARGWRCHVHGEGRPFRSAVEAVQTFYAEDPVRDDQFLPAFVLVDDDGPVGRIVDGDSVLFFNFRGDRAIEISRAFEGREVPFDRGGPLHVTYAGMMEYDGDTHIPAHFLVAPPAIDDTVGDRLVRAGLSTWACSETQKFGHVTYFFNGNRSGRIDERLETWLEVPSDRLPFQERPWMKAAEITDAAVAALRSGPFDHLRLNYANGDMVGHTGDLHATRVAVAAVDLAVGRLWSAVREVGGVLLVTADHGNADEMVQRKGDKVLTDAAGRPLPRTSHTLNPVPFLVLDAKRRYRLRADTTGSIARVGTTVVEMLGLPTPEGWMPGLVTAG